jgi:DNA primase
MNPAVTFSPDGNDLRKVMYYYGLELDDKIICPFHDDNRPSCHVDYEEGFFHCFACGASGNAFDFVRLANEEIDGLNQLILYYGILNSKKVKKLKVSKIAVTKRKQDIEDKAAELELAYDYYMGLKTENWKKVKSEYKTYMVNRGFTASALNMCGAKHTITNKHYPLVFPIYDLDQFKGYVCRTTNKVVEKDRKYLYNKGFSRIDTLGGNYNNDVVVVVEGYMDALKMRQFGLKYVAALFGWKATRIQIDKLKAKGVKTIISALDMDKPGRKGTDYLKNFFDVIEFQFPQGVKDPGDLNQQQFDKAYLKTKKLFRGKKNVDSW